MKFLSLLIGLLFALCGFGAEGMRAWTDVKGNHVEACFVKAEGSTVMLKLKDGKVVPAKIDNLCEADRAYVKELTYVPRDITVVYKIGDAGTVAEESGVSPAATLRDTVTLRVVEEADGKKAEPAGDSRWKIESVDALGNRLPPKNTGVADDLVTEGKFVFVTYTVENDSNLPMTTPSPVLVDKRGRKFLQAAQASAKLYIPANTLLAGVDPVPPGFKKLFVAFYELPLEAEPARVEVFPSKTSRFAIEQFKVKGKQILLSGVAPAAEAAKPAEPAAVAADKKASVFLRCVRVGQGGDTSGYWYYDRNKKRSLSYGVELRRMGDQQSPVTVKSYFIGTISNNRDVVVDKKEESVVLEPGKIARITVQSNEVEEYTEYYYSGARISGAKLKGLIVQVWDGNEIVASFVSMNQWKKYSESADVVKQMGELTVTEK